MRSTSPQVRKSLNFYIPGVWPPKHCRAVVGCRFFLVCSCQAGAYAKLLVQLKGHTASERALDDLSKAKDALEAAYEDIYPIQLLS